jgi:REP element-mobilizing transposase RayT
MIHGYHVILPVYGFWLPNDPRGSWSDFVGAWELARFGRARKTIERQSLRELTDDELRLREEARAALKYPPVCLSGLQARAIVRGFAKQVRTSGYTVWACAVMPEHTHLVIARHSYAVEQMANLLKGAATRQLNDEGLHPLADFAEPGKRPPRMWAERLWKHFLNSDEAIENAITYVNNNPLEEGKPAQQWSCVTPYAGLPEGGWTTYH